MFVDIVPASTPSRSIIQFPSSALFPNQVPLIARSTLPESTCHPSGKYCPAVGEKLTVLVLSKPLCHSAAVGTRLVTSTTLVVTRLVRLPWNGGTAYLMGVVVLFVSSVSTR